MEPLGGILEGSWARLGASWGPLGDILGASGERSWGQDGAKLGPSCDLEPSWQRLGGDLQLKLTQQGSYVEQWPHSRAFCSLLRARTQLDSKGSADWRGPLMLRRGQSCVVSPSWSDTAGCLRCYLPPAAAGAPLCGLSPAADGGRRYDDRRQPAVSDSAGTLFPQSWPLRSIRCPRHSVDPHPVN